MRARPSLPQVRRAAGALAGLSANVRLRLTLWYVLILAVVVLIYSVILLGEAQQSEAAAQRAQLANVAQGLASAYNPTDGLIHFTPQEPAKFTGTKAAPASSLALPGQGVALFADAQGAIVQTIGPLTAQGAAQLWKLVLAGSGVNATGDYGVIAFPANALASGVKPEEYVTYRADVVSQGQVVGILVVALPNEVNQTARLALPGLLIAGPVALLVAALGGYWLASRALRPVRVITRAAQQISETDLSRRLHVKRRDELGELAATFDHMLARLEAAFARQRQFTADASHELRTPLTIVNLEVTRALAEARAPEEYQRALGVILEENQAMSRLVSDLLTLARADGGAPHASRAPLDLSDVALEAVERLAGLARRRGVRLVVAALPEVVALGDRGALTRGLVNLVENGIKYTAGVGSQVTVSTRIERDGGRVWAVASVRDDGPGVALEHLPYLFDRFYRVDAARAVGAPPAAAPMDGATGDGVTDGDSTDVEASAGGDGDAEAREGSGLGLAITRWVAESHGGEAHVRSEVGSGATFEVWLPALEA